MANIKDIAENTSLIQEAIENNQIPLLNDALIGMFNLRKELLTESSNVITAELHLLDETIGRVILYLADWNGIDTVAGKLLLRGAVSSRGDVMRIAAPIYDYLDGTEFPDVKAQLIGVVGQIASGKGTVGDIISKTYNSMHLPLSNLLRYLATSKGSTSPHSREVLRDINDEMKPRFGNPVFVRWALDMARRLANVYKKDVMSFDGFRTVEEAEFFKAHGGTLIAVTASADTRFMRLVERHRGADDFTREEFDKSDEIEQAWITPIISIADTVIPNEGTPDELQGSVLQFMKRIRE